MSHDFYSRLRPVRRRQQVLFALDCAGRGLLVGASLAIVVAIARLSGLVSLPWLAWSLCLGGLLSGVGWGIARQRSWRAAARAVDQVYDLKDRTATAIAFLNDPNAGPLQKLQIADALDHLGRVRAREVAPWVVPRSLTYALAAFVLVLGAVLTPVGMRNQVDASPAAPLMAIVQEAQKLEQTLVPALEELAKQAAEPTLDQLVADVRDRIADLKAPGVDLHDALATLSEMQALIAASQSEFNAPSAASSLKQLGKALAYARPMHAAADALQEGDFERAAPALERIDPAQITPSESRAAADQLRQTAPALHDDRQIKLSETAENLAEALENEEAEQIQAGLSKLGEAARTQALRDVIAQRLHGQLTGLSESKDACQANCHLNGGQNVTNNNSPQQTWGLGVSGKPLSDGTAEIRANFKREELTGQLGDGPSEKELEHAAEAQQQATREYRQQYAKYRRLNESVLESESLPLGHRQTIRKYFESIRPRTMPAPSTDQERAP